MANPDQAVVGETALPQVIRELLSYLRQGSFVPPEYAIGVWAAGSPTTADDAIEALVVSRGITRSQGDMIRGGFVSLQQARLSQLLAAALQRGLVTQEDIERAAGGFAAEALELVPRAYLIVNDVLTRTQLDALEPTSTTSQAAPQALPRQTASQAAPQAPAEFYDPHLGATHERTEVYSSTPSSEAAEHLKARLAALRTHYRSVATVSLFAATLLVAVTCHWVADVEASEDIKRAARVVLYFLTATAVLRAFAPNATVVQQVRHGVIATLMLWNPVSWPDPEDGWALPAFLFGGGLLLIRRNLDRRIGAANVAAAVVATIAMAVINAVAVRFMGAVNRNIDLVEHLLTGPTNPFGRDDGIAIVVMEFNLVWMATAFFAMWLTIEDDASMPGPAETLHRFVQSRWSIMPLAFALGGLASTARALVRGRVVDAEGMFFWGVLALVPVWWVTQGGRWRVPLSAGKAASGYLRDSALWMRLSRAPTWVLMLGVVVASGSAIGASHDALSPAGMLSAAEGLREVVTNGAGTKIEMLHVLGVGPSDAEIVYIARDQIMLGNMFSGESTDEASLPSYQPAFEVLGHRLGMSLEEIQAQGVDALKGESLALAGVAIRMLMALLCAWALVTRVWWEANTRPDPRQAALEAISLRLLLVLAFFWFGIGAGGPFFHGRIAWLASAVLLVFVVMAPAAGGRLMRSPLAPVATLVAFATIGTVAFFAFVGRGLAANPGWLPGAESALESDVPAASPTKNPIVVVHHRAPVATLPQSRPAQPPLVANTGTAVPAPAATTGEVGESRLLRAHAVRLFSEHGGAARPFRWTDIAGQRTDLAVSVDSSRRLTLTMSSGGAAQPMANYSCGSGPCTAFANQREDGLLVVRFTTDAAGGAPGTHLFALFRQTVVGATVEVSRWTGTLADYTDGLAPDWARVAPDSRVAISLSPLPAVSCGSDDECARLATALWFSLNHRYTLAYAQEALRHDPRSPSALSTVAAVHASVGDAEGAAHFLGRLSSIGTAAALQQLDRAQRDTDFDPVRADPRVTAVLDNAR